MKKVFRKIQKGTTKMIERIKSLGEMETKQKCVVQRFEIIIPLHQKITTQYIASASFTCGFYNPQIQISAESETKRSIFREKDKTKRSKKESAQHSKSRNKSFVMTSVSAL